MLRADRDLPISLPSEDVFRRAIATAAGGRAPSRQGFWWGVGVGAALSAPALAILAFSPVEAIAPPSAAPQIVLNVNEQRDVSVALSSPEPLADARDSDRAARGDCSARVR